MNLTTIEAGSVPAGGTSSGGPLSGWRDFELQGSFSIMHPVLTGCLSC